MTVGVRRDYDKKKYQDDDDKPWSYDSRGARSEKDGRKDRGDRHWMETRPGRSPSRIEMKSVVERKVRKEPKSSKEEESRSKESKTTSKEIRQRETKLGQTSKDVKSGQREIKSGQTSKDGKSVQKSKEAGKEAVKKGIMSDSMRELVRQSIKENKELAQEVVEEESDDSPEHFFQVLLNDLFEDLSSCSLKIFS